MAQNLNKLPQHHGLELVGDSFIRNLGFEPLAADPVNPRVGIVWLNSTDGVVRYTKTVGGVTVIRTVADAESAAEANALLQAALAAETADRIAGDAAQAAALQTEIDNRIAATTAAASAGSDQLATETTARLAGDAASVAADAAIQSELDATQVGAGLSSTGAYIAPTVGAYTTNATSLADADAKLDAALAAEVAAREAAINGVQASLTAEAQTRSDADAANLAALQAYVDSGLGSNANADHDETVARIAEDAAIKAELDLTQAALGLLPTGEFDVASLAASTFLVSATTQMSANQLLDTAVEAQALAIAAETAARTAADVAFTDALNTETAARVADVAALQAELNTTQSGAGLETTGAYAAPTGSNYLGAAVSLKDADFVLDAQVKTIADQVTALTSGSGSSIATVEAALAAEAARALAAEGVITDAVVAEAAAARAAESTLTTNLATEVSDRQTAVNATNAALAAEAVTARAAEAAAVAALAALVTTINSRVFSVLTASADTHTITHGLNDGFTTFDVQVEGVDGIFGNDYVRIEAVDVNTVAVYLNTARRIKLVARAASNIG